MHQRAGRRTAASAAEALVIKPYEVQADGAAPRWIKFRRRVADKREALRVAVARAKRGVDVGPVVVYDLRRPGTNVASCEWWVSTYDRAKHRFVKNDAGRGHGKTHVKCRIFQPLRKRRR